VWNEKNGMGEVGSEGNEGRQDEGRGGSERQIYISKTIMWMRREGGYLLSSPFTTHSRCTFVEASLRTAYSNVSSKWHTMGGCRK
jgi:hypothetical protein